MPRMFMGAGETIIEQLSHEIAILKRYKLAKRSRQISPAQGSLLNVILNTDLEAIDAQLKALRPTPAPDEPRQQPKSAPLPMQKASEIEQLLPHGWMPG